MQTWIDVSRDVRVQLLLDGKRLLGIGEVRIGGVAIRSAKVPLRPDFSTPDAVHYQDFVLKKTVTRDGAVTLRTTALGRPEVLSNDLMDEYDFNIAFPRIRGVQEDSLDWKLSPRELELDGQRYVGFSLGFEFKSKANEIHRFLVAGTWEIGGNAVGNTIYHQSQVGEPVYTAAIGTHYTTACLKRLDLWHSPMGYSYQFSPRWASMQPFDFQSAKEGVLLGYWKDMHSVKSLIHKNPGEDVIFVIDEYDFELTRHADVPAKQILFSASPSGKPRRKHEVVNMWTRAMEHTGDIIRGFYGIKPSVPLADPVLENRPLHRGKVHIDREELAKGPQDDWLWREENGRFYFMLDGEKVESHDLLRWTADKTLPLMHEKGIKRMYSHTVHESDFTALAFAYHAQTGWHGDLYCSSVCGSHRYVPAEFYGGWTAWRYFASEARRLGISLGHWIGFHLTPRAPILREHPEYLVKHAHTKHFGGGYGHQCICAINWRSGARDWFLNDLRRWFDEGLEWLWFDSWPNLACLSCNYEDRMAPMQAETPKILAELQKIGYKWFGFEGTSPFGVHAYGLADPMRDYEGHVQQGVCGQNDFGKRIGHEYMAYNEALLDLRPNPARSKDQVPEWRFRFIANRSLNMVSDDEARTYMALLPLMKKRILLPDDHGVLWEDGYGKQALFAYASFQHPVPKGAMVTAVKAGVETPVDLRGKTLKTRPFTAYRIG